jgi:hypothetical protein
MQYSAEFLDNLIAPKLSALSSCCVPEVPEMPPYHQILAVNQALSPSKYKDPVKTLLLNFMRRLHSATVEYRSGRESLLSYLSKLPQRHQLGEYDKALSHFQDCILRDCPGHC